MNTKLDVEMFKTKWFLKIGNKQLLHKVPFNKWCICTATTKFHLVCGAYVIATFFIAYSYDFVVLSVR